MGDGKKKKILLAAVVSCTAGIIYGSIKVMRLISGEMKKIQNRQDLFEGLYRPLNEWFAKEQAGHTLRGYLEKKQYKSIGIYGMGNLANRVYDALKDSDIKVACCIDQDKSAYSDTVLITLEDEFPVMDAVIITDFRNGEKIMQQLKGKGKFDMLLLEDIIFNEL